MYELRQHTKLIEIGAEEREALAELRLCCEWCDMPLVFCPEYHTLTKLWALDEKKKRVGEWFFMTCSTECYKKEDKKLDQHIRMLAGESFVASIEEWGEEE